MTILCAFAAHAQDDKRDDIFYASDTERPVVLAKKFVRNTLIDQKEIWTSPFHMRRGDAKWWLIFGGATAALIATDRKVSRALPNTSDQKVISRYIAQPGAAYTTLPVAAGFYIIGALVDSAKARETGVLSFEALTDSAIVVTVLKSVTQRERPEQNAGNGRFFAGGNGFPSGHSILGWSLASVVAHEYHDSAFVPLVAYGLAGLVSVSRVTGRNHFPSDVVVGGGMGWFIGRYVYQTHQDHALHKHAGAWARPSVAPMVGGGTYGVALAWTPYADKN